MTNKSEALALLTLEKLTPGQRARLNVLTAQQAGYAVNTMNQDEYLEAAMWIAPFPKTYWLVTNGAATRYVGPEFVTDVGDCLTLPGMTDNLTMRTLCNRAGFGWEVTIDDFSANPFEAWAKTPTVALLIAWWKSQKEGG